MMLLLKLIISSFWAVIVTVLRQLLTIYVIFNLSAKTAKKEQHMAGCDLAPRICMHLETEWSDFGVSSM